MINAVARVSASAVHNDIIHKRRAQSKTGCLQVVPVESALRHFVIDAQMFG